MRAASMSAKARSGAVEIGSDREPTECDAPLESRQSVRCRTHIQVLPRRNKLVDDCAGDCRSGSGYNPLRRVILDGGSRGGLRDVVLAAMAVRTAGTGSIPGWRTAAARTAGSLCTLSGATGVGLMVAGTGLAAATHHCPSAGTATWTRLAARATAALRSIDCFETSLEAGAAASRRLQTLHRDCHGCEPDKRAGGQVLSNPHGKRSQCSPPQGRKDSFCFIGAPESASVGETIKLSARKLPLCNFLMMGRVQECPGKVKGNSCQLKAMMASASLVSTCVYHHLDIPNVLASIAISPQTQGGAGGGEQGECDWLSAVAELARDWNPRRPKVWRLQLQGKNSRCGAEDVRRNPAKHAKGREK